MKTIEDFLDEFTRKHNIQTIETLNGVVIAPINDKCYLVNTEEVGEKE